MSDGAETWTWSAAQGRALEAFSALLASADSPGALCRVRGLSGSGKTTLLKEMARRTRVHYGEDASALVLAPTNIAAARAGGATIHRELRVVPQGKRADTGPLSALGVQALAPRLLPSRVVLLDNANQVGNTLLYVVDQRLRQVCESTAPFGGRIVVLFEDVFSLKGVPDDQDSAHSDVLQPFRLLLRPPLRGLFCEVTFARALRGLSKGVVTAEDAGRFERRHLRRMSAAQRAAFDGVPHLCATNAQVELYDKMLRRRPTAAATHTVQTAGQAAPVELWAGARVVLTADVAGVAKAGALCRVQSLHPAGKVRVTVDGADSVIDLEEGTGGYPLDLVRAHTVFAALGLHFEKVVVVLPRNGWQGLRLQYAAVSCARGWDALAFDGDTLPRATKGKD